MTTDTAPHPRPEVEARTSEILQEYAEKDAARKMLTTQPKEKPQLESEIVKSICRYLNGFGRNCKYWKNLGGAQVRDGKVIGRSLVGRCDLEILLFGKMYFMEVKRPGLGRVSDKQTKEHHEIKEAGGAVHIVTSVDDVRSIIEPNIPERELFED